MIFGPPGGAGIHLPVLQMKTLTCEEVQKQAQVRKQQSEDHVQDPVSIKGCLLFTNSKSL